MIDLIVFIKIFCPVFLIVASVGPCMLTYGNISMNYGYKKGFIAATGCFTIDILYITLGIFAINAAKSIVPDALILFLGLFAGCFLLYIAYGFWHTTADSLRSNYVKDNNLTIYLKLLCLTISSPMAIVGYASVFSAINNVSENILSIFLGAVTAAFLAHSIVVVLFAIVGKKISTNALLILNKISATIIVTFAFIIIYNSVKPLFS